MDMVLDTGASNLPDIYPDIEATGVKYLTQNLDTPANNSDMLVEFFIAKSLQTGHMPIGDNHQVTRIIGITIHYDKVPPPTIEEKVSRVISLPGFPTQNTSRGFLQPDILHAPRCPKHFHPFLLAPNQLSLL